MVFMDGIASDEWAGDLVLPIVFIIILSSPTWIPILRIREPDYSLNTLFILRNYFCQIILERIKCFPYHHWQGRVYRCMILLISVYWVVACSWFIYKVHCKPFIYKSSTVRHSIALPKNHESNATLFRFEIWVTKCSISMWRLTL